MENVRPYEPDGRGYVTIAQNSGDTDYLRMAYALALSLKITQSTVNRLTVFITKGMDVPEHYRDVFDKVIELPWTDYAEDETWKIHNKWKIFHVTPYEETVLLDSDMLFTTDVSSWWDIMSSKHVWACTDVRTYRGGKITHSHFREDFRKNDLPNIYTAFLYFKMTQEAADYFDVVQSVYLNWYELYKHFHYRQYDSEVNALMIDNNDSRRLDWYSYFKDFPSKVSGDLAFSIAMKLMMKEEEFTDTELPMPSFVHMKMKDQQLDYSMYNPNWTKSLMVTFSEDCTRISIGNYTQHLPLHYVEKESFLTDELLYKLEISNV